MWRSDPFRSMQVWRWASNLGMVPGAEGIQNRKQRIAKIEFNSNPPRLEVSKSKDCCFIGRFSPRKCPDFRGENRPMKQQSLDFETSNRGGLLLNSIFAILCLRF